LHPLRLKPAARAVRIRTFPRRRSRLDPLLSCAASARAAQARVVPNEELAAKVDTSDEWIVQRTGIRQRYIAGPGETTSTLAAKAAEAALGAARPQPPPTSISSSSRPRPPT
jgi:3-oxoacyl-[acyl-carrier-protein] synthase-3